MAKRYPANIRQAATWSTGAPNPHAVLGAASNSYTSLALAQAAGNVADADTLDVFVLADASNWAIYEDAAYDHSNGWIDFSGASLHSNLGTISDTDAVTIEIDAGQTALESFGEVVDDTTPQLGGDLDLNGSDITGTGNIDITGSIGMQSDTILVRDAANTLALRDGANANTLNVYNTWTDASNYERGGLIWAANSLKIGTEKAGTGSTRILYFCVGGTDVALSSATAWAFLVSPYINSPTGQYLFYSGAATDAGLSRGGAAAVVRVTDGSTGGGSLQLDEQTPPSGLADSVRLYADDSGGKTRLMAIFGTGAAQQVAIEP